MVDGRTYIPYKNNNIWIANVHLVYVARLAPIIPLMKPGNLGSNTRIMIVHVHETLIASHFVERVLF